MGGIGPGEGSCSKRKWALYLSELAKQLENLTLHFMLFENINMEGIERKMELMVSFNETHQLDYSVLSKDDDYDEV